MGPLDLRAGDKCPNCGGPLDAARTMSADDYRRVFDRDNPLPPPIGVDTMAPELVAQHGPLFVCHRCRYKTRTAA